MFILTLQTIMYNMVNTSYKTEYESTWSYVVSMSCCLRQQLSVTLALI